MRAQQLPRRSLTDSDVGLGFRVYGDRHDQSRVVGILAYSTSLWLCRNANSNNGCGGCFEPSDDRFGRDATQQGIVRPLSPQDFYS